MSCVSHHAVGFIKPRLPGPLLGSASLIVGESLFLRFRCVLDSDYPSAEKSNSFSRILFFKKVPIMVYQVYRDVNQQWRWRLIAGNNRIIANSGEGFHNKPDCLASIALVQNSAQAPVKDV